MGIELVGICSCKVEQERRDGATVECVNPGEVLFVNEDGTTTRKSVFEVAADRATAGENEFAVFECLRRSALARCQQSGS